MKVKIKNSNQPCHFVSEMILGHNLIAHHWTIPALLSDRLSNSKFLGPADTKTGLAPEWHWMSRNQEHVRTELTQGMSLSGNESQMVHNFSDQDAGILQSGVAIRKDEKLEVEIWAKVKHHPAKLFIFVTPEHPSKGHYLEAEIIIDSAYWKKYKVILAKPAHDFKTEQCDDDSAVFRCYLRGEGVVWFDQIHLRPVGQGHLCSELIEKIGAFGIPTLRFPGGCNSTNYHWYHGVQPVHKRPVLHDPVSQLSTSYDFGVDEYLELCFKYNIKPFITVDIGSGTPQEAHEWAEYCANWFKEMGKEVPCAYFQMGNEQYGTWETSHMTGQMYVNTLKEFVPAVKSAYPNSKIIALGEEFYGTLRNQQQPAYWRKDVLEKAADIIDVLALNRYKGQWYDDPHDKQINVAESVTKIEKDLKSLIKDCYKRAPRLKVAITEWNYLLQAWHWDKDGFREPGDAQHGLYISGILNLFSKLGDHFEVANFFNLVNPIGIFIRRGTKITEESIAEVFRLYRPAFPGKFINLEVDSPRLGNVEAAVDAICIRQDDSDWLFITNRDDAQTAEISLSGFAKSNSNGTLLCAKSPLDQLQKIEVTIKENKIMLPPLSIARFKL